MPRKKKEEGLPKDAFFNIGSSGLKKRFGHVDEEFLVQLKGERGRKVFKQMSENDSVVGAVLFAISMLMRGVDWRVDPEDDTNQDDLDAAAFIEEVMQDMEITWDDFICEVLSMLVYGWSWFEKIYKIRDGENSKFADFKIGISSLALRSQDSLVKWIYDDKDTSVLIAMQQRDPETSKQIDVPFSKSILFRTQTFKNNPEGRSALRTAYKPWFYKSQIEQIEAIGIERDLAGLPYLKVPAQIMTSTASVNDKALYDALKKMAQNIRRDEQDCVIMPSNKDKDGHDLYSMELMSTGGKRQFDTSKIITRYDQRIAMTLLADFILLGHSEKGSFALSSDKTNLFGAALGGWLGSIKSTINENLVNQLLKMNGMKGKCKIEHGDLETQDLGTLAEYVSKLTAGGVIMPDRELENVLLRTANLPEKNEDDEFEEFEPRPIEEEEKE